jgi:nucleoside-diphosphate-sugar epimerase
MPFRNKSVLITGGLGFIGSSLTIRLVKMGARVTIIDSSVEGCGANDYNIAPVRDELRVIRSGICEASRFNQWIREADVIFNLAGEISHVHSLSFPERDLQLNTVAQLQFLLACVEQAPGIRVVYASTRQVYGAPEYLPIDEEHPIRPIDFNGVHKYAATMYHLLFSKLGQLDAVALRLTNIYGPRMALNVPCQGFLSTFLRRLLLGQPLEIFGDGNQLRDPVYIDDAVDAFLLAGAAAELRSRVYNVGGLEALRLAEIAELMCTAGGVGPPRYRPFPEERKAIDIGSYYTDSTRIREHLDWSAKVPFSDGIRRTLDYYRDHFDHYLNRNEPNPACKMPEHAGLRRRLTFAAV